MSDGHIVIHPEECRGCRSCQLACSFVKTGQFSPSKSCIQLERDLETEKTAPMIETLCCDLCGGNPACVDACHYGALSYEPTPKIEVRNAVLKEEG